MSRGVGRRLDALAARYGGRVPPREDLPAYVAPLPGWLEDVGLRLAWLVVAINLAGTAFGFWYYRYQFGITEPVMLPFVPDSPLATLLVAAAFAAWKLDRQRLAEWLAPLAFFGSIKLGAWTPFVLVAFPIEYPSGSLAVLGPLGFGYEYGLYAFLVTSHLAMVVQAFVLYRIADFRLPAIALAATWYGLNDLVDYFFPVVGQPHHTLLSGEPYLGDGLFDHSVAVHDVAAVAAVALTVACIVLALATRRAKRRASE